MSPLLGDILKATSPTLHSLVDGATIRLIGRTGASFDPEDLDASTGGEEVCEVPCESPWPYRVSGTDVATGNLATSFSGQHAALTLEPKVGMLAEVDGRTYMLVEVTHDLDADDWLVVLEGAG